MRRARGMTLIEVMIVLAIIAIMGTVLVISMRAGARNGHVMGAAQELKARLAGLRSTAMSENADYLLVVVDAPDSDGSRCTTFNAAGCAKYVVLREPSAGWKLDGFDVTKPGGLAPATARVVDVQTLPIGVHLDTAAIPPSRPAPFTSIPVNDPELLGNCTSRSCFAVRFTARGQVLPQSKSGATLTKGGVAFVLGTDLNAETKGALRQELLITFPAGIVKTLAF